MKRDICPVCKHDVATTAKGAFYKHGQSPLDETQPMCAGSGKTVSEAAKYVIELRDRAN